MGGASCKGRCGKLRAAGVNGNARYAHGQKRCSICQIFMMIEGNRCPCCKMLLRVSPKLMKYKEMVKQFVEPHPIIPESVLGMP